MYPLLAFLTTFSPSYHLVLSIFLALLLYFSPGLYIFYILLSLNRSHTSFIALECIREYTPSKIKHHTSTLQALAPLQPNFSRQEKVCGPCALEMRTRRVGVKMAQAARAGLQVAAAAAFLHLFFLTNVFIASFEKGRKEAGWERAREGERGARGWGWKMPY